MELTGIHHLTAVSANIRENHLFYTRTMGMRLVKRKGGGARRAKVRSGGASASPGR